jgi:hypothetical protein
MSAVYGSNVIEISGAPPANAVAILDVSYCHLDSDVHKLIYEYNFRKYTVFIRDDLEKYGSIPQYSSEYTPIISQVVSPLCFNCSFVAPSLDNDVYD